MSRLGQQMFFARKRSGSSTMFFARKRSDSRGMLVTKALSQDVMIYSMLYFRSICIFQKEKICLLHTL
ncbi:hypothetical protein [Lysinibacillus xylanilyticus]|uniref:hypothetical protein n=1 Tax=Lysinibacillus xylanilyticus TaxID=582475 RepID=UPI003D066751